MFYAFEHTYGVTGRDQEGVVVGAVLAFPSEEARDDYVAKARIVIPDANSWNYTRKVTKFWLLMEGFNTDSKEDTALWLAVAEKKVERLAEKLTA